MNYEIRRAKIGDEATLAHIQTESWKTAFQHILTPEALQAATRIERATMMYRRILEQNYGNGYLLSIDGNARCIAWWSDSREEDMPGYAELICIHSLPDNRGKGFGSKMMDTVLRDVAAAGYKKIMLWVFEKNTRARHFYETHGFTPNGKTKSDADAIELCYEKEL